MLRKTICLFILIGTFTFSLITQAETKPQTETIPPRATKAIDAFVNQMVRKYGFDKIKLSHIMSKATYDPKVIHWITHPFEKKPWDFYRRFFLRQDRIDNGAKYWSTHQQLFKKIQKQYGVDPSVIIAIIGIESYFGEHAGTYNELNALTTLSFYYPKREKFFRSELSEFLLLTRHEKLFTFWIIEA